VDRATLRFKVNPDRLPAGASLAPIMLVKRWAPAGRPAINTINTGAGAPPLVDLVNEVYNWKAAAVTARSGGLATQGGTTPPALFESHVVAQVRLGTNTVIIFDPSYGERFSGTTLALRLQAWQNGSLDFVGGQRPSPTEANTAQYLFQPITAKTTTNYLTPL
jgi:hypothetical protein